MIVMMIIFTAAYAHNYAIGYKGRVPWQRMKADRERLHELTTNKTVVLGERTYREYEDVQKTLRTNKIIVISRNVTELPDAIVVPSLDTIIERGKHEDMWVNGGGSVFTQLLPYAGKMYLTEIDVEVEADTFFPAYSVDEWRVVKKDSFQADNDNPYPYTFLELERKQ
jgi:dihydrofolate reductase